MFGEYELGILELGAGAITVLDPGSVPGYEAQTPPEFRTTRIRDVARTFVVPASDRYAELSGRVGGIAAGSQLDFNVDWRAWLQGDVIVRSNWTNALGDRVDDAQNVEHEPDEDTGETELEAVTWAGEPITWNGQPLVGFVLAEDEGDTPSDDGETDHVPEEERVGSGTIRSGVTSIIYQVKGTSPVLLKNSIVTARARKDERTLVLRGEYILPTRQFEQDPSAVLDYRVDFSSLLPDNERLYGTSADMLDFGSRPYFALTPGMTFVSRTLLTKECIIWLGGGTVGKTYLMTLGFNTTGGKTVYGQFAVTIKEK